MGKVIGEKEDIQVGKGDRNLRGRRETLQDLPEMSCFEIENTKKIPKVQVVPGPLEFWFSESRRIFTYYVIKISDGSCYSSTS